jgi:predicted transcriptional regulator
MEIDGYVIETLMPDLVGHDRHPAAFLVYLHLWSRTHGASDAWTSTSLREMAEGTGLSKRAVQTALARLVRRRLVSVRRDGITSVGEYRVERPWARPVRR